MELSSIKKQYRSKIRTELSNLHPDFKFFPFECSFLPYRISIPSGQTTRMIDFRMLDDIEKYKLQMKIAIKYKKYIGYQEEEQIFEFKRVKKETDIFTNKEDVYNIITNMFSAFYYEGIDILKYINKKNELELLRLEFSLDRLYHYAEKQQRYCVFVQIDSTIKKTTQEYIYLGELASEYNTDKETQTQCIFVDGVELTQILQSKTIKFIVIEKQIVCRYLCRYIKADKTDGSVMTTQNIQNKNPTSYSILIKSKNKKFEQDIAKMINKGEVASTIIKSLPKEITGLVL